MFHVIFCQKCHTSRIMFCAANIYVLLWVVLSDKILLIFHHNMGTSRQGALNPSHFYPTSFFSHQGAGSGLSSILPKPKNITVKETDRPLIPHTLTKRPEPKAPKLGAPAQGLIGSSASPSAIKAAAKSAALQVAKQIAADDLNNEDDITPQNYFSLEDSPQPLPAVVPGVDPEPAAPAEPCPYVAADEPGQSNAPLDFGGNQEEVSGWDAQYNEYPQPMAGPEARPEVKLTSSVSQLYFRCRVMYLVLSSFNFRVGRLIESEPKCH